VPQNATVIGNPGVREIGRWFAELATKHEQQHDGMPNHQQAAKAGKHGLGQTTRTMYQRSKKSINRLKTLFPHSHFFSLRCGYANAYSVSPCQKQTWPTATEQDQWLRVCKHLNLQSVFSFLNGLRSDPMKQMSKLQKDRLLGTYL
jgi:hypothetical protein